MQLIDCQTARLPSHWHETGNILGSMNSLRNYEKRIFVSHRLTNILDLGIKSRYRLLRMSLVALLGRSDANDILCKSLFSNDQTQ